MDMDSLLSQLKDWMVNGPKGGTPGVNAPMLGANPMAMVASSAPVALPTAAVQVVLPETRVLGITAEHPEAAKLIGGTFKDATGSTKQIIDKIPETKTWLLRDADTGRLALHKDAIDPASVSPPNPYNDIYKPK